MILIGLSGKQQVGKDTVGDHLVSGYGFEKYAWADKLKEIAMDLWGLTYEECYTEKTERSRFIMQKLGTEVARSIDDRTWINYLMRTIKKRNAEGQERFVIVDTRFPNEADAVIEAGGKVWRIEREERKSTGGDDHPSETSLDNFTLFSAVMHNNGNIKLLHEKIDHAMLSNFPVIFQPQETI